LDEAFGRSAPRLLDVGVGNGAASVAWAQDHPDRDVVAVELHRPGLARLIGALASGAAPNVRIAEEDVTAVLDRGLAPGTFDAVRVLFPDPWPKRRHVGRRLVDARFVDQVAALLPPGGTVHVATDWDDYAEQVHDLLVAHPDLELVADAGRPARPVTIYEGRGRQAGRSISDLLARRG
jgi:tRNA (guanine-N7-)-methyltransferase